MCPDKKLQWFEEHSYDSEGIEEVCKPPTDCWNGLYKPEEVSMELPPLPLHHEIFTQR